MKFLLLLCAIAFSADLKDAAALVKKGDTLQLSSRKDSLIKVDSLKLDSTAKADSAQFKFYFGGELNFLIPTSGEFSKLRSNSENILDLKSRTQGAEYSFANNDITFPFGITAFYRIKKIGVIGASLNYFSFSNKNVTTSDSVNLKPNVNYYSLSAFSPSLELQINLPAELIIADGYSRIFLGMRYDLYPVAFFKTERTVLNQKINSRGTGFGFSGSIGGEKRVSDRLSIVGEIGYNVVSLYNFYEENDRVLTKEVFTTGSIAPLEIKLKALFFSFKVLRGLF